MVALVAFVASHVPLESAAGSPPGFEYVVCLGADRATSISRRPVATELERLRARLTRSLVGGLPLEAAAVSAPARLGAVTPSSFAPERVWLLEAADSVTARAAALQLVRDGAAEWTEPVVVREPADGTTWPSGAEAIPGAARRRSRPATADLPADFPNDPLFRDGRQWGLRNTGARGGVPGADIHAAAAWRRSCGGPGLRLALVDTGVDPTHPELQSILPDGARLEGGLNVTMDPSGSWADSVAHGTAVAGVMAARTGDGAHFDSLGIAGVCGGDGGSNPGCHVVPIKVTAGHATVATSFDIARGILAAVARGARAVNVSFGGAAPSRLEREALRYAIERGCLVVAASGNRGASAPREPVYPAAYAADRFCLQVGATDAADRRATFSSYGPGLDLVAPGVDVWTTYLSYPSAAGVSYPGYVSVSGTSFAAPFVTGAAGLLVAARPELAADDVLELLCRTARDVADPGPDTTTGFGVLDADAALAAVAPHLGIWHDEVAADTWIEDGVDSLVVSENGPGNLTGPRTWAAARRIEARAAIALPDSFEGEARAWPRIAGTSTVRGDFRLPYFAPHAEVTWTGPRTCMLRGWLYRVEVNGDSLDLPLPYDQARFGFTVVGPVRRPAVGRDVASGGLGLRARPNPFTSWLSIERPAGTTLELFDLGGRRVRAWAADGSVGAIVWDGCDAMGRRSLPGLYWLRASGARGSRQLRVIKLE